MSPLRALFALDSFKGGPSAREAASALARGWRSHRPDGAVTILPLADGGEGTIDAVSANIGGALRQVEGLTGPDGRRIGAVYLADQEGTAYLEVAAASGLPAMAEPDPLIATSRGTGELIATALEQGATRLVVALGGSATVDGGAGLLAALGLPMFDRQGRRLRGNANDLLQVHAVEREAFAPAPVPVIALADVNNPLLGERGAARRFGPQKGADPEGVERLETAMRHWADLMDHDPELPGSGAAGGIGFALSCWGAELVGGGSWVADKVGLDEHIAACDLVVTGEGRFDRTSLEGKVIATVLERAERHNRLVAIVAGELAEPPPPGVVALSLSEIAGTPERSLQAPLGYLEQAGRQLAERDATTTITTAEARLAIPRNPRSAP